VHTRLDELVEVLHRRVEIERIVFGELRRQRR
jgi:hypothetical protein